MSVLAQLRVAIRSLGKNPGFTITAIATLGISIGACSAIFSVVNAVLLAPLPYKNPEQLAFIWADIRGRNVLSVGIASADFNDLRRQQLFTDVATVTSGQHVVAPRARIHADHRVAACPPRLRPSSPNGDCQSAASEGSSGHAGWEILRGVARWAPCPRESRSTCSSAGRDAAVCE
jgi:hypothetical protein